MRLPTSLLPCFLFFLSFAFGASAPETAAVLKAEQSRVAALIADDHQALARLMLDNATYTHSNAKVDTKAEFLESLTSGRLKYKSLAHSDQQVRVYGTTALLTGVSQIHSISNGSPVHIKLRFILVYVREGDSWRMAAWQSTRIPD